MRQVISPNQTALWTRNELTERYGPMRLTRATAPAAPKPQLVIIPQGPRRLRALVQRMVARVRKVCGKVAWILAPRSFVGLVSG